MSTPHNKAEKGQIAKTVIMPGDPRRSKFITDTFLENPVLVNDVRGVQGYTGTYQGKPVTVMASGMGMPSIGIYSYELYKEYDVENIIRVGSAGSYIPELKIFDVVLATGAWSESSFAYTQSGDTQKIQAEVPLSNMFGYATALRSTTQGRGTFVMQIGHFAETPKNIMETILKK